MVNKRKTDFVNPDRYQTRREVARNKSAWKKYKEQKRKDAAEYEDKYWSKVWESDGFDVDPSIEPYLHTMLVVKCKYNECPLLVTLYAKMGLHRYNMIQGTDLQLDYIVKYNKHMRVLRSSFFITLVAWSPAKKTRVTFQTSIREEKWNLLDVECDIARLKKRVAKGKRLDDEEEPCNFFDAIVPKWPTDDALADKNRFYVVPESEWQENDWIRLYLELAYLTTNRYSDKREELPGLKIVEVMVETKENVEPPNAKLKGFRDAYVYIKYCQDLGEGQVCKRRAIFTRSVDLRTERMSLMGNNYLESETDHSEHHEVSDV